MRMVVLWVCLGVAWPPVLGGGKATFEPRPGPRELSPQEKALAPVPSSGSENGVVLVHETTRLDDLTGALTVTRHVRAKIFTSQAREVGDVELPFNAAAGSLKRWWGWTLCPDGSIAELKEEDLHETTSIRFGRRAAASVLRGTLPGVQPGCVVDYGYSYWEPGAQRTIMRLDLQGPWPIRELRVRWTPLLQFPSAYRVARASGLKLRVEQGGASLEIHGADLPAVLDEPNGPPSREARGSAVLYYRAAGEQEPDRFWDATAREVDRGASSFLSRAAARTLLEAMRLPAEADLQTKLRLAHDWIAANIANDDLPRWDQEAAAPARPREADTSAKDVLDRRRGSAGQLDALFLGVARALGADAHLVLATDNRVQYFDRGILSVAQLTERAVATRAPGAPEEQTVFSDAGAGLPFGEVPWWLTGVPSLMATPEGARVVTIWPAPAERNVVSATARIVLDVEAGAEVVWSRTGRGQQALEERRELGALSPPDRSRRLDELCGASGRFEISKAEAPSLDGPGGDSRLTCEGTLTDTGLTEGRAEASVAFQGPWIPEVFDLASPARLHPVLFAYPRLDRALVEIEGPPGFEPGPVPAPVSIESPYGLYELSVTATPAGYRLARVFALGVIAVPSEEYAALRAFLQEARRADGARLEFRRRGGPS